MLLRVSLLAVNQPVIKVLLLIPANPAYGVYISQLVRYARICTSKVDFINRLRGLSLRLRQQGFETNRLQNSFNKFVNRHGFIVEKYGAALREMRLAIQA